MANINAKKVLKTLEAVVADAGVYHTAKCNYTTRAGNASGGFIDTSLPVVAECIVGCVVGVLTPDLLVAIEWGGAVAIRGDYTSGNAKQLLDAGYSLEAVVILAAAQRQQDSSYNNTWGAALKAAKIVAGTK